LQLLRPFFLFVVFRSSPKVYSRCPCSLFSTCQYPFAAFTKYSMSLMLAIKYRVSTVVSPLNCSRLRLTQPMLFSPAYSSF
jgi:hypothetical protein